MKKFFSYLVVAAVAVALGLLPGSAQAALDLNSGDTVNTFATEIDIDGTNGTALANPGNIMDTTAECGFGAAVDENRYIRFDLSNDAEFVAAPAYELDLVAGVLSAGGIDESYVIYSWTAPVGGTASDDNGVLTITAAGVTVYNQNSVTMSYAMYETAGNAVNQTSPLASSNATLIEFEAALDADFDAVTPDLIDVTEGSTQFDDNGVLVTVIGDVNINVDGTTLWADGDTAAIGDLVAAGTKLVITGDFTATQDLTDGVPDGTYTPGTAVYIDNNGLTGGYVDIDVGATSVNSTTASFTLDAGTVSDTAFICIACNGESVIQKGYYTGLYEVTAAANSDVTDETIGTVANPLSTLLKNGSTARLTFALTPGGTFVNYIRVTNPSSIAGSVYLTVINDSGDSVNFDLATVTTVDGLVDGQLSAGASTNLISIVDIYAAAQEADATFAVSGTSQKLRLDIEAEFGTTGVDSGIVVNAFSLSTSADTFNMLQ